MSAAREAEPLFPVVGMAKPTLHRDLPEVARDYDVVVIDGAPRVNELGRAAIMAVRFKVPARPASAEDWVRAAKPTDRERPATGERMKRLTIDVSMSLHTRIKIGCAQRGQKMADMLRDLLEREFPPKA
jgi:hypothetical protein